MGLDRVNAGGLEKEIERTAPEPPSTVITAGAVDERQKKPTTADIMDFFIGHEAFSAPPGHVEIIEILGAHPRGSDG